MDYNNEQKISECYITCVENPMNGSFRDNILIIPNEINLLPDVADKPVDAFLAEVNGAVKPIGTENSDFQLSRAALLFGIESVEKRCAVVPFDIVQELA